MRAMLPVQRSMDNFILAATQAQVEGVDRIAQVFVQRMNVALGQEFERLRQALAEAGAEQRRSQQEMRAAAEAISQMTQDVVNMHQLSQGVLEHFKAYVQDMDAARREADENGRQTIELLRTMDKTVDRQAQYMEKLGELQHMLEEGARQYAGWNDKFLRDAREQTLAFTGEVDRVTGGLREGAQALSGAYEEFTKRTQESLARTTALFDESITTSIRQMNATLEKMSEQTRAVPQLMSQSRERYAEQVDQFVTALVKLQKAMERLGERKE